MVGPHRLPCETPPAAGRETVTAGADRRWALPATVLGSSLGFIDGSVVNVALPAIRADLEADLAAAQWVMNGYMLMLASLILLGGAAGDRFGRRRVFLIGLCGFAAASLACALAPTAGLLIGARTLQGAAAALLTPTSLAIISGAYSGQDRGKAIGIWAGAGALATALGPPLGGWLVDSVGWRPIFMINLPLAALAVAFALAIPSERGGESKPLDLRGAVLAVLALGLLSYGLIAMGEGRLAGGAVAAGLALPAGALFVLAEKTAAAPMMPLGLFASRTFSGVNLLTVGLYAALSGALFLLPFVLIEAHGYSAMGAGAAMLPFSIILGLGSRWAGGLVEKIGARTPLIAGPCLTAAGFALLALMGDDARYWTGFLPGLLVVAAGMTLTVAPLTTTVFNAAPDDQSGVASGINNAAARGGGLIAVAALGLAFGGADLATIETEGLLQAFRRAGLAAAVLALAGAGVAAFMVGGDSGADRTPKE